MGERPHACLRADPPEYQCRLARPPVQTPPPSQPRRRTATFEVAVGRAPPPAVPPPRSAHVVSRPERLPALPAHPPPKRRFRISRWRACLVVVTATGRCEKGACRVQGRAHLWGCGQHRRRHGTQQHHQREASPHVRLRVHATLRPCGLGQHCAPANQRAGAAHSGSSSAKPSPPPSVLRIRSAGERHSMNTANPVRTLRETTVHPCMHVGC